MNFGFVGATRDWNLYIKDTLINLFTSKDLATKLNSMNSLLQEIASQVHLDSTCGSVENTNTNANANTKQQQKKRKRKRKGEEAGERK